MPGSIRRRIDFGIFIFLIMHADRLYADRLHADCLYAGCQHPVTMLQPQGSFAPTPESLPLRSPVTFAWHPGCGLRHYSTCQGVTRKEMIHEVWERMRIEYEDKDILVVYKEAGLPVQTGKTSGRDLASLLRNYLAEREGSPTDPKGKGRPQQTEPYLGIVHRLDQPVEGILVFAKTPKAAAALSAQAAAKAGIAGEVGRAGKKGEAGNAGSAVRTGKGKKKPDTGKSTRIDTAMEKIYQAVVCLDAGSYPLAVEGLKREVTLTDWLGRDRISNMAYVTTPEERGAKRAELIFRTKWIKENKALLEIRLLTGRHHQIRIQMAHAGMPLAGDRKYGNRTGENLSAEESPLCLCAVRLSMIHPSTGKKMEFCVEPSWLPLVLKDANMIISYPKPI